MQTSTQARCDMKVKMEKCFIEYSGFTEGNEYNVIVSMDSATGGVWAEVVNDVGITSLIKLPECAFGAWEIVNED